MPFTATTGSEFVIGLDGKTYPRRRRWTNEQMATWVHCLTHKGRSIREIVGALAGAGIRVSVGTVHRYRVGWTCSDCSGEQRVPPEHLASGEAIL